MANALVERGASLGGVRSKVARMALFAADCLVRVQRLGRRQLQRVSAFQLALGPLAVHAEDADVGNAVVQMQPQALREVRLLRQHVPVLRRVVAPQRRFQIPERRHQVGAVAFDDALSPERGAHDHDAIFDQHVALDDAARLDIQQVKAAQHQRLRCCVARSIRTAGKPSQRQPEPSALYHW